MARQLRAGTSAAHADAERAGIMRGFMEGRIAQRPYCALLRNLHPIYQALERALQRHAAHADIAPVYFPQLWRTAALETDLRELFGTQWAKDLVVESASADYLARLDALDRHQPELLVAHAYVRYLGDLSGGQILRRLVEKALGVAGATGTAFYRFVGTASPAELAQRFRAGLDALRTTEHRRAQLVTEAQLAFGLHNRLFEELAARFSGEPEKQAG